MYEARSGKEGQPHHWLKFVFWRIVHKLSKNNWLEKGTSSTYQFSSHILYMVLFDPHNNLGKWAGQVFKTQIRSFKSAIQERLNYLLLLLLSRFSHVQLCATLQMAAHQAPPSLGFSRQEHWSGLPFPSPMHESEKWKWSRSVVSDPQRPHGMQPTRLLRPWDFPGRSTGVGCHCLLQSLLKNPKRTWSL